MEARRGLFRAHPISEVPRSIGDIIRIIRGTWSDLRQATAAEEMHVDAGKSARLSPRRPVG